MKCSKGSALALALGALAITTLLLRHAPRVVLTASLPSNLKPRFGALQVAERRLIRVLEDCSLFAGELASSQPTRDDLVIVATAALHQRASDVEATLVELRSMAAKTKTEEVTVLSRSKHNASTRTRYVADGGLPWEETRAASTYSMTSALQPFVMTSLVCVAVGLYRGMRPVDLFSADIFSAWEVAVAFTVATLIGLLMVREYVALNIDDNPLKLYIAEFGVSFAAVTTMVPMVMGGNPAAPKCFAFASPLALLWFGSLWLSTSVSILPYLSDPSRLIKTDPSITAVAVVLTILFLSLVCTSGARCAVAMGIKHPSFPPFYEACRVKCSAFVAALGRGEADPSEAPVVVPAAVLAQVVGTATVVSMIVIGLVIYGWQSHNMLDNIVVHLLTPVNVVLAALGHPIQQSVQFAISRITWTFYGALLCALAYSIWLLRCVLLGYQRLFMDMELSRPFHGHELLTTGDPNIFNPQWGTYCAGALMGNALLAFFVITGGFWLVFLVLSLPEFWEAQWALRNYWTLYGLLYATRWYAFRYIVPRFVVTDSGVVLRRRCWAILFPTLTVLNFVLGATSGVVRTLVMLPYMCGLFFRVDVTFLPGSICDWDWSYQPFLCLVMHSHKRLNPAHIVAFGERAPVSTDGVEASFTANDALDTQP